MPFTDGLPRSDRQDELQELSMKALEAVVPASDWIIRPESKDKGVDVSLELKMNGQCTNLRVQVQLKSTDEPTILSNGSVSYPVPVHNLKYLLNGPGALYILYIAPQDELRFVWAQDEYMRLETQNAEWVTQSTVTLHFSHKLDATTLGDIRTRLRQEARVSEQVRATVSTVSLTQTARLSIDMQSLDVHNNHQMYQDLLEQGTTWVSKGRSVKVLDVIGLLDHKQREDPHIELLSGYANFTLTRYFDAMGSLGRASLRQSELSHSDQEWIEFLRLMCNVQMGRTTAEEYAQREALWRERSNSVYALALRFEAARRDIFSATALQQTRGHLEELHGLAQDILNHPGISDAFKLQTRLFFSYSTGASITGEIYRHLVAIQSSKRRDGLSRLSDTEMWSAAAPIRAWEESFGILLQEALDCQNSFLIATAYEVRAIIRCFHLSQRRMLLVQEGLSPQISADLIEPARTDAENARYGYKALSRVESELRSAMVLADILEVAQQVSEAKRISMDVLPRAQSLSFFDIERRAQDHLRGTTILQRFEDRARQDAQTGGAYTIAEIGEEKLVEMARLVHEHLGRSEEKFLTTLAEVRKIHQEARQRIQLSE